MRSTRLFAATVVLLLACWARPALFAQTPTESTASADVDRRVSELEKQLDDLRQQIAGLKQDKSAAASAPAVVPANAVFATNAAATGAQASEPAKAPLAGLASVLNGATVTGLVDTYYSYDRNQPASRTAGLRLFDSRTNQFALSLVELGLVKAPDSDSRLGYNITFGFGDAMNVVNSGDPTFLQYLKEAYASYLVPIGKGLQVDAGKFVTPNGAEVIESNANWNYSRSLLFNYAIPFYHFGVRAKYAFSDKFSLTGYVVNGWNNVIQSSANGFTNSGKTGGFSAAWNVTKKLSITENWMGGPGATPADANKWRNLSDTVVTYSPTGKLTLMANTDYGRSERDKALGGPADWSGAAGYVKYQFNPRYAVATRYEYYNDHDAFTTGTAQHIQEVTATFERRIAQHLVSRFEYRHDVSDQPFFQRGANNTPVKNQSTVAAGLVFVLEPGEANSK